MKKAFMAVLLGVLMSAVAFAGPYFEVEMNPIAPDTVLTFGYLYLAENINATDVSFSGDVYVVNENLWLYPTPWQLGGIIGIGTPYVRFSVETNATFLPAAAWTDYTAVDMWESVFKVTGHPTGPSGVVTIWASLTAGFDVEEIGGVWIGIWEFYPTLGIRCEW